MDKVLKLFGQLFHVENRFVGFWVFWIEMHGRIVQLYVVSLDHLVYFRTCPDSRTIAMSCEFAYGTVGIEGRVERKACAYAGALHLALLIDVGIYVVPSKDSLRAVGLCVQPALVDGMGNAVAVDGCARCFKVCVRTIEQLMPASIVVLQREDAVEMHLEILHYALVLVHVEKFASSEQCPSICSSPEE